MTTAWTAQQQQSAPPPTPPTAPPSAPGGGSPLPMQVEAQFLGGFLGDLLRTTGPVLLDTLRNAVSSSPAAAANDPAAIQQEAQQTQAAFLGFLGPILTTLAPLAIDLVRGAVSGQAAGTESAGTSAVSNQGNPPTYVR
jgi:hypothetical protein